MAYCNPCCCSPCTCTPTCTCGSNTSSPASAAYVCANGYLNDYARCALADMTRSPMIWTPFPTAAAVRAATAQAAAGKTPAVRTPAPAAARAPARLRSVCPSGPSYLSAVNEASRPSPPTTLSCSPPTRLQRQLHPAHRRYIRLHPCLSRRLPGGVQCQCRRRDRHQRRRLDGAALRRSGHPRLRVGVHRRRHAPARIAQRRHHRHRPLRHHRQHLPFQHLRGQRQCHQRQHPHRAHPLKKPRKRTPFPGARFFAPSPRRRKQKKRGQPSSLLLFLLSTNNRFKNIQRPVDVLAAGVVGGDKAELAASMPLILTPCSSISPAGCRSPAAARPA